MSGIIFSPVFLFPLHITSAFLELISFHSFFSQRGCAIDYSRSKAFCKCFFLLPPSFLPKRGQNKESIRMKNLSEAVFFCLWINHRFWCCSPGNVSALENRTGSIFSIRHLFEPQLPRSFLAAATEALWPPTCWTSTKSLLRALPASQPCQALAGGRQSWKLQHPQRISWHAAAFICHHPRRPKV